MEIIGKGDLSQAANKLGAVWVARKLPDGAICAHANQARITTFAKNSPEDTLFAPDVISFARDIGLYTGSDDDFSFSDVYDPLTFGGARFCEARVWSMFGKVMGKDWMNQYEDYAMGYNMTNRMPLFVHPPTQVSTKIVMEIMRDHYEGLPNDMQGLEFDDVGASSAEIPVRAHPLTWTGSPDGKTTKDYFNERPVGTQQTGWCFVATSRSWKPKPLRGVMWWAPDDSSTSAHLPIYGSASHAPAEYAGKGLQQGVTSPMLTFNQRASFWAFNVVANWAYTRWNLMYPELHSTIVSTEDAMHESLVQMDMTAERVFYEQGYEACVSIVTKWSDILGKQLVDQWNTLFGYFFVKYRDGYITTSDPDNVSCVCKIDNGPYPQAWYENIVKSTGKHYEVPTPPAAPKTRRVSVGPNGEDFRPISKKALLARR